MKYTIFPTKGTSSPSNNHKYIEQNMCKQNMQISTGWVKAIRTDLRAHQWRRSVELSCCMQTTEVEVRSDGHQDTSIPRSNDNVSQIQLRKLKAHSGRSVSPYGKTPDTAKIYYKSNGSILYSLLAPLASFIRTHSRSTKLKPNYADI